MNARGSSFIPLKLALTPPNATEKAGTERSQINCRQSTRPTAGAPLPQVLHGPSSSSVSQTVGKPLSVARTPQTTQSPLKRPSSATSGFHDEWLQLVKERAHLSALVATSPQGSTQAERDAWRSTQTRNEASAQASEASGDYVLASAYLAAAEAAAATRRAATEAAGLSSWYERLVNVHPSVKNAVDHALVHAANEAVAARATAAAPPAARVSNRAFAGPHPGCDFSHADAIGYRMVSSPLDQWRAMRGALELAAAGARYEPRGAWSRPGDQTRRSQLVACQLQADEPGKPVRMFTAIPQQRRDLGEHATGERHGKHHVERRGERHGAHELRAESVVRDLGVRDRELARELRAENVMRDRTAGASNWYEQRIAPTLNDALETVRVAASPYISYASPYLVTASPTCAKKTLAARESNVLVLSKQAVDQRAENDIRGLGVHVALPMEPAARPSHADRLEHAIAARRSEAAEKLTEAMKAAAARRREVARERALNQNMLLASRNSAAATGTQFKEPAAAEKVAAEKAAAEKAAAEKAAAEKAAADEAAADEAAAESARAAARRCREREIALELKQQLDLQRREREKRTAEEARLEVIRRRDAEHKQAAQHRQAAQQAALERQQMEAQRVAVSAARAELTAGCPAGLVQRATELGVDIAMVALELDVEKELEAVLSQGRELCTALREAMTKVEAKADATETCVVSWSLAARFVACHRRQELWRRALQLPPPPVLVLFHGTRSANAEAIVSEGLRLPDGAAVKFSTNLASRHGTGSIFASLNFARALLHADGPRATFLLLGLPGEEGPIDHAQATYVFSEEAALLPCYLPQGTEHARELARLAREVARVELYGSGEGDM